jgi:hypothetical protein
MHHPAYLLTAILAASSALVQQQPIGVLAPPLGAWPYLTPVS